MEGAMSATIPRTGRERKEFDDETDAKRNLRITNAPAGGSIVAGSSDSGITIDLDVQIVQHENK